jgi:hypothetical protein
MRSFDHILFIKRYEMSGVVALEGRQVRGLPANFPPFKGRQLQPVENRARDGEAPKIARARVKAACPA